MTLPPIAYLWVAMLAPEQVDWNHPNDNPVRLRDNGFCAGASWITLLSGEKATVDYGPDFNVYRVRGPGDREWGVYYGTAGQARPGRRFLVEDGVTVSRGTGAAEDGRVVFNGYFAGRKNWQNHFFGNVFRDSPADSRFFSRVRLGRFAKIRCAEAAK